jgi:hypothetical protein
VVGSVGQVRVGRTGFTVDLERKICGSMIHPSTQSWCRGRGSSPGGADTGQIWLG